MKVRLDHNFNASDKTLNLLLNKDDSDQYLVDQFDYENLSKKELMLIGRLVTGFNIAFKKMWH